MVSKLKKINEENIDQMGGEKLPYRRCVSIVLTKQNESESKENSSKILKSNKSIFIADRVDFRGSWQMPQGGVEEGESYLEAAKRELKEETGISSVKFIAQTGRLYKYDFPLSAQIDMIKKHGYLKYSGQELCFVELEFTGDESEINLDYYTTEFCSWRWTSPKDVVNSIVLFKRSCYQDGLAELGLI